MMSPRTIVVAGVALAVGLAAFVSPFASSSPDGLERVAGDHHLPAAEKPAWTHALIPDYQVPGISHEGLATAFAGVIGTMGMLAIGLVAGRLLGRKPAP
jgi:cobalt/nickel transport protein